MSLLSSSPLPQSTPATSGSCHSVLRPASYRGFVQHISSLQSSLPGSVSHLFMSSTYLLTFYYGSDIVLGMQRSIHSITQLSICVEQLLCVLDVSYTAKNKATFMEFIIYGEGGRDKQFTYINYILLSTLKIK